MDDKPVSGKIILINGASSAGKTTLSRALQNKLEEPFWHFSIDHLREGRVLPMERIKSGEFAWPAMRPAFFEGFHRSLPPSPQQGTISLLSTLSKPRRGWLGLYSFWLRLMCSS
jgi:chloramphenicol 3-O phosphotransferase